MKSDHLIPLIQDLQSFGGWRPLEWPQRPKRPPTLISPPPRLCLMNGPEITNESSFHLRGQLILMKLCHQRHRFSVITI